MGVLTYTAKRNIIGGHTLGLEYKIETAFQVVDPFTKEKGALREMLDDTIEYELDSITEFVMVESDEVVEADKLLWKEFTTSVQGREQFKIDLTGTIAAPGTDLNCIIWANAGYKPRRTQPGVQQYKFSFTVRFV